MEFTIVIKTGFVGQYPLDDFNPGQGRDLIEAVREGLPGETVPLDVIESSITCHVHRNYEIHIYENFQAEINGNHQYILEFIPQFEAQNRVEIIVPPGYLSKYQRIDIIPRYEKTYFESIQFNTIAKIFNGFSKKKLNRVTVKYSINDVEFIKEWIEAGCPNYFHCSKEQIETDIAIAKAAQQKENENSVETDEDERVLCIGNHIKGLLNNCLDDIDKVQGRIKNIIKQY